MVFAILIGFEYRIVTVAPDGKKTESINFPGTFVDLDWAYQWCRDQKFDTAIITDIAADNTPTGITKAVVTGRVNMRSLNFYAETSKDYRRVTDRKSFIDTLTSELSKIAANTSWDKKLFIYYTGHGHAMAAGKSSFLLPTGEPFDFDEIRTLLTSNLDERVEILGILDCCYPTGMRLPYKLSPKNTWDLLPDYKACKQEFLLITAATPTQTSVATQFGSLFTKMFFEYLHRLNEPLPTDSKEIPWPSRNLLKIADHVSREIKDQKYDTAQTLNIYSAYKVLPIIPLWIGNLRYSIEISMKGKMIMLIEK